MGENGARNREGLPHLTSSSFFFRSLTRDLTISAPPSSLSPVFFHLTSTKFFEACAYAHTRTRAKKIVKPDEHDERELHVPNTRSRQDQHDGDERRRKTATTGLSFLCLYMTYIAITWLRQNVNRASCWPLPGTRRTMLRVIIIFRCHQV